MTRKTKSRRIPKRVPELTDLQKWKIEQLATNGGFSDRYIASQVFNLGIWTVTMFQILAITRYRSKIKTKLWDWRNGVSNEAQSFAHKMQTGPRRTLTLKRA